MSDIKKVTLDGSEVKIETGGQNTIVKNLSTDTIYASAFPNITAEADNVAEIASGTGEVIYGTHGTVYLLGKGRVQCTGTDYATVNFKKPSRSKGGGGKNYKTMTAVIDLSNSDPETAVTYADDAVDMTAGSNDWDDFFGHYPCLFKDGAEVGKLQRSDFNKFEDGTTADISSGDAGDVMIAFPRRGLKIETIDNKVYVSMTHDPNSADFEYNAHRRGDISKNKFYIGAYLGYVDNSKLRSLSEKEPTTTMNLSEYRNTAHEQGQNYNSMAFYQLTYLQSMFILKYKTRDSQQIAGKGYNRNHSKPVITGGSEEWGMDCDIIKKSDPSYLTDESHHAKLFGIEDLWGNVAIAIDGLKTDSGTRIYTATTDFNDSGDGYVDQGSAAHAAGWLITPQGTTGKGFIVRSSSPYAHQDKYFCDSASLSGSSYGHFGGVWNINDCGIFHLDLSAGNTDTTASRLMFL